MAKERHGLDGDVEKCCENCRYFSPNGTDDERGDCRRHAPVPSSVRTDRHRAEGFATFDSYWPTMSHDDWCGEFEEIDAEGW